MTTDDGTTSPDDREKQVKRLPEPSPLTEPLTELVAAEDRAATAAKYGLDYRETDGMVKVEIELRSDGELPESYRVENVSQYRQTVQAYVHIDDLVPLAMEDDVRIVREPPEPRTGGPTTN